MRYGHMITGFFLPAIKEYDLNNMWFQQGFIARDISCRGDINCPLTTPIDFFVELRERPCLCR